MTLETLRAFYVRKKIRFLFQNNLSVVHLGCMESADCGRVKTVVRGVGGD